MNVLETMYDTQFQCTSKEDCLSALRALKNEMKQLMNIMEHPDYKKHYALDLDYRMRLSHARDSIETVKKMLEKYGCIIIPNPAEIDLPFFQNRVSFINKIELSFKNSFNHNTTYTATLNGNCFEKTVNSSLLKQSNLKNEEASIDKQEFLDMIYDLYINEWSLNYDLSRFGLEDSEAIHWEFKVYYSDSDEPVKIQGAGVYPYNFSQLEYIFDIDTWC